VTPRHDVAMGSVPDYPFEALSSERLFKLWLPNRAGELEERFRGRLSSTAVPLPAHMQFAGDRPVLLRSSKRGNRYPRRMDVLFLQVGRAKLISKMNGLLIEQTAEHEYRLISTGWEGTVSADPLAVVEDEGNYRDPTSLDPG
jgi:hypothetical protein